MSQEKIVQTARVTGVDIKLEVVVIPVSDGERAKEFYQRLGWRLDVTPSSVVQFTPPGSGCSVQFGGIARRQPQALRRVFGSSCLT